MTLDLIMHLMEKYQLKNLYIGDLSLLKMCLYILERLVQIKLPEISNILVKIKREKIISSLNYFVTNGFSHCFPQK